MKKDAAGGPKIQIISDDRVVDQNSPLERSALIILLVLLYVAYGALGRDVFFNHLNYQFGAVINDPIGTILPFVRLGLSGIAFLIVCATTDLRWAFSKIPWLLAPFCLMAFASALWADDPKEVLRSAAMTTTMWMSLSVVIHRLGLATATRVTLHVVALVCILSTFVALAFPLIGRHSGLEASQTSHIGEWRGIFGHKNGLGPWAAYGSVFLFTYSGICGGPRLYWWAAGCCALACLIFANSATAVVMALFLWGVWLCFIVLRRVKFTTFLFAFLTPVCLLGLIAALSLHDLFALLGRDTTFTGRTLIWQIDWDLIRQSLFLGHGFQRLGGMPLLYTLYNAFGQPLGPESGYFALLLDMGIVGFLLFFIPYAIAIRNGFEWIKHVTLVDRASLELQISVLLSALIGSFTVADMLMSTGYDGVLSFTALFALLTTPKSPEGYLRGEFRIARYRVPERLRRPSSVASGLANPSSRDQTAN